MQDEYILPPFFSWKSCESQRGAESALESFEEWKKNSGSDCSHSMSESCRMRIVSQWSRFAGEVSSGS
jgi:hypothetical protein